MKKLLVISTIAIAGVQFALGASAHDQAENALLKLEVRNQTIAQQICWDAGIGCK